MGKDTREESNKFPHINERLFEQRHCNLDVDNKSFARNGREWELRARVPADDRCAHVNKLEKLLDPAGDYVLHVAEAQTTVFDARQLNAPEHHPRDLDLKW